MMRFHTRCIPREQLVPGHPVANAIIENGLCDTFSDETLKFLRDLGVSVVEARAVWAMLEPRKGQWDWAYLERCLEAAERNGMKMGLFAWPQHAPSWFLENCPIPRLRCLDHDQDSRFLSFWDPRTVDAFARFYQALAERFAGSAACLYVGSAGCFGEPQYPQGVTHYHYFANTHNHVGWWCGDHLARRDFAEAMVEKHGSIDALSRAWRAPLSAVDDIRLPAQRENPAMWNDFGLWYSGRLTRFVGRVFEVAREAFPGTPRIAPIGTRGEPLAVGQDKWAIAREAAARGMMCRWTGCGNYEDFAQTNVDARRLSSACRLLGCEFGTEAALDISEANGLNCIYEQISNGAALVHDDPGNYRRNAAKYAAYRAKFRAHQPKTRIGVFYSKLQQRFSSGYVDPFYAEQCVQLRSRCDFEILDEDMIREQGLGGFDLLISFGGWVESPEPARTVGLWLAGGGRFIEHLTTPASPPTEDYRTLGTALGEAPSTDFAKALDSALAETPILPGLTWGDLRGDSERCYITRLGDELLCYNAGPTPCTLSVGRRRHPIAAGAIEAFAVGASSASE